jgi:protoheme IX farnesyltransferase
MSEVLNMATVSGPFASVRARLAAAVELAKPRIAGMVLVATVLGFYLAIPGKLDLAALPLLLHTIVGTALVASGANAFNQLLEAQHDANMDRTRFRPLPSGRLTASEVLAIAAVLSAVGVVYLALLTTMVAALVAAAAWFLYVFAYTPLKRVTSLCVFVGAIPGAMPPLIGWAAVAGDLPRHAFVPFAILYFWQLPHFAAISWLYRDDYARAGYPLLSVTDRAGLRLNMHMITHTLALMAASLLPVFYRLSGAAYGISAAVFGLAFLACGVAFVLRRTRAMARFHLLASIVYLPLLFSIMMLDKTTPA